MSFDVDQEIRAADLRVRDRIEQSARLALSRIDTPTYSEIHEASAAYVEAADRFTRALRGAHKSIWEAGQMLNRLAESFEGENK